MDNNNYKKSDEINDKADESIREKILSDAENIEIPDGLSTENIIKKLEGTGQKKRKFYSAAWFKIAAGAAACLAVAVSVLAANGKISLYYSKNYDTVYVGDEEERTNGSYEDIYAVLAPFNYSTTESTTYGLLRESETFSASDTASKEISDEASSDSALSAGANDTATVDYYDTNEQEENVHEADVVKTDGEYIYTLDRSYYYDDKCGYDVRITSADGSDSQVISEIKSNSGNEEVYITDMYINENRLVLVGIEYNEENVKYRYGSGEIIEDVAYSYIDADTVIITYDVSDPKNPEKLGEIKQNGDYITSRMSGNIIYTISSYNLYDFTADDCVPTVNEEYVSSDDVYIPSTVDCASYVVVSAIDITNPADVVSTESVIMGYCDVYMSQNNLYLLDSEYEESTDGDGITTSCQYTNIVKINCDAGNLTVEAEGKINGYIYDSYAVDEFNGYLRIATTEWKQTYIISDENGNRISEEEYYKSVSGEYDTYSWEYIDSEQSNNVFVLDENLEMTGSITGIAEDEDIYSVRFIDRYGYFVTYENTDPLFAVDFANPEEPVILSELKVSGFSSYLHVWSDDYLLGIGEETDEDGGFYGIKVSMFDKSDLLNIKEKSKIVFGDAFYTPAEYNYKSIMAAPEKNMLGFLIMREGGSADDSDITDGDVSDTYSMYHYTILSYDEDNGFTVAFDTASSDFGDDTRGIYIDDYLYIVSPDSGIKVYDINSYENILNIEF